MKILITGAAGFIGHHLANYLKKKGHYVRGIDWKDCEYQTNFNEFIRGDLRDKKTAQKAMGAIDEVYHLAADMGGIGFIQDPTNHAKIIYNNTLINLNVMDSARIEGIKKIVYSSSACIYPKYKQTENNISPLKEEDAYPAEAEDAYGWEKLHAEHLALAYNKKYGMQIKIVRFHNIYGPEGEYTGGREKAPAALCRKVSEAIRDKKPEIEIWGDGEQTRSFCYIDDCLKALEMVMNSDLNEPINIGRDDMISINDLARTIMKVANVDLSIKHIKGWEGVRGRNSDNTKFKNKFKWEPEISMQEGLSKTYKWVNDQVLKYQE